MEEGGKTIPWQLLAVCFSPDSSAKEGPNLGPLLSLWRSLARQFCHVNTHLQDLKGFMQSLRERWRQWQTWSTFRNFPPQIGALKLQLAEKNSLKVSQELCSPTLFFPPTNTREMWFCF